jgi:hypothetical protein
MALKSKVFAGDKKLEAALVSDSAHVAPGASGPHVAKIQRALVELDRVSISVNEIANRLYGPSTADAVLAFKTKRNIVNRAYQSKADNIVGKMTIAALDAAMFSRPSPPAPAPKPATFFVTADVKPGQTMGGVLGAFGLDAAGQLQAFRDPHNDPLHGGAARLLPDGFVSATLRMPLVIAATVIVPIDIQLSINEFKPVIDTTNGLRPRRIGDLSPPTCTHGVSIRVGRNLGPGTALNWIQTVKKLNNSDPTEALEFVDGGHNNLPFGEQPPAGVPASEEFSDVPCGPIAPRPGAGEDFTAMTTLAVLVRGHIILAAGTVWRFVIGPSRTLPSGVLATAPRDATDADFRNQLRILRTGIGALHLRAGPNLDYIVRPPPNTVVP